MTLKTPLDENRLFIALPVRAAPPLAALLDRLGRMPRAVRPVQADQLHLTLKFLGDVKREAIDAIRDILDEIARSTPPFTWSVQELGAFPNAARPRVVWAGCVPPEPLTILAGLIEDGLITHGFERDRNAFRPHLTLARIRGPVPQELRDLLNNSDPKVLAEQSAKSVILYRSILGGGRATHQPLHETRLTGP